MNPSLIFCDTFEEKQHRREEANMLWDFAQEERVKFIADEQRKQKAWKQAVEHITWFVSLLQNPRECEFARAARQAITISLTQEEYDTWYSDLLAFARQSFQDKVRGKYQTDKQAQWYARFEGNTQEELEIIGSDRLRANIMRILELVKEKLPFRYQQVIQSFKRIEFVAPEALIEDWTGYRPAYQMGSLRANSNGYFTVDGGEPESEEFWRFARTFLHECGHNVHGHFQLEIHESKTATQREREARAYAETLLAEITSDFCETAGSCLGSPVLQQIIVPKLPPLNSEDDTLPSLVYSLPALRGQGREAAFSAF